MNRSSTQLYKAFPDLLPTVSGDADHPITSMVINKERNKLIVGMICITINICMYTYLYLHINKCITIAIEHYY